MKFTKPGSWPGLIMNPRKLSIKDYTYSLPDVNIAAYPLPDRDASRLLIYQKGTIREDTYRNLANYIAAGSMLVFNNTKVLEARILFQKNTGAFIEIFCLAPHEQYPDISTALQQKSAVKWKCLLGGASKWKPGQVLEKQIQLHDKPCMLSAVFIEKREDAFIIEMSWTDADSSFAEILHASGAVPLPPYIKRIPDEEDKTRYQTIYALDEGSVAAPTAGLHFTPAIFKSLTEKKINLEFLTLHVGAGTFKPVTAPVMQDHFMHAEFIDVSTKSIESIIRQPENTLIAVGTTSLRTLETLYWLGVKLIRAGNELVHIPDLGQWEPYDDSGEFIPAKKSLTALLRYMQKNKLEKLVTQTRLLIAPGYRFRIARTLITNFHQPESTLLLLVAALAGKDWKKIYDYALDHNFRFLSYGDGCLIEGKTD